MISALLFGCGASGPADGPLYWVEQPPVLPSPPHRGGALEPPDWLVGRLEPAKDEGHTDQVALPELTTPYGLPYEPIDLMSGFDDVRGRGRIHAAIDFEGVGPDNGLGTPIFAIGRSRVTMLGSGHDNPREFGRPLRGSGTVRRSGSRLPRSLEIPGYGRVYFFTRNYGRWRSGTVIVTELLDGPLAGYQVRYMHLGAIHPDLRVGDEIERGQEIGLMGGTAVQDAPPHLHIDVEDLEGERVDLAPYIGLHGLEAAQEVGEDC